MAADRDPIRRYRRTVETAITMSASVAFLAGALFALLVGVAPAIFGGALQLAACAAYSWWRRGGDR